MTADYSAALQWLSRLSFTATSFQQTDPFLTLQSLVWDFHILEIWGNIGLRVIRYVCNCHFMWYSFIIYIHRDRQIKNWCSNSLSTGGKTWKSSLLWSHEYGSWYCRK